MRTRLTQIDDEARAKELVESTGHSGMPAGRARIHCAAELLSRRQMAAGAPLTSAQNEEHENDIKVLTSYKVCSKRSGTSLKQHTLTCKLNPEEEDIALLARRQLELRQTTPIVQAVHTGKRTHAAHSYKLYLHWLRHKILRGLGS